MSTIRLGVAAFAVAALAAVGIADERRMIALAAEDRRLVARITELRASLARRPAILEERDRLRARLEPPASSAGAVAAFVRHATAAGRSHGTRIVTLAAAPRPAGSSRGITLDVGIEGSYAGVLATVASLSGGPVAAAVDVVSLVRKNAVSRDATITAALRVVLDDDGPRPS